VTVGYIRKYYDAIDAGVLIRTVKSEILPGGDEKMIPTQVEATVTSYNFTVMDIEYQRHQRTVLRLQSVLGYQNIYPKPH
jgi:hypothetical protein